MDTNLAYSLFELLSVKGIGPIQVSEILNNLHSKGQKLDGNGSRNLLSQWLNARQMDQLTNHTDHDLKEAVDKLESEGFEFITLNDSRYPEKLKAILGKKAPPFLILKGNSSLLNQKAIGFCGSRKASERGLEVARDCAEQLAKANIVVVSGHASGVDLTTHAEALKSGGSTIMVLAEGILNFRIRKALQEIWDWNRVLVMSEFLPNDIWRASRAMLRNNTIIGLSDAMILIESGKNGGSMDAGKKTLGLKRRLFVPLYDGMPDFAIGNRILLNHGAIELRRNAKTNRANLKQILELIGPNPPAGSLPGQQLLL